MTPDTPPFLLMEKIVNLLKDSGQLDAIKRWYIGVPFQVPWSDWPYGTVSIDSLRTQRQQTGNRWDVLYRGLITFDTRHQDIPEGTEDRVVVVPSYLDVWSYAATAVGILQDPDNYRLGRLTWEGGAVQEHGIADENLEFGVGATAERVDSALNYATIPFTVWTKEIRS